MIFLTIIVIGSFSILVAMCFSKTTVASSAKVEPAKKDVGKVPENKKIEMATLTPQPPHPSAITAVPIKTSPDGLKTAKHLEPVPPNKTASIQLKKSKEGSKKKSVSKTQESAYAGVENQEVKVPSPKTPSVVTLPSKEPEVANPSQPTQKVEINPAPPKAPVEINENSDDTIENIPSVRKTDGPSFEGTKEKIGKSGEGEKK